MRAYKFLFNDTLENGLGSGPMQALVGPGLVAAIDDIPANATTTRTLTIDGASATSSIDSNGDHDWFAVNLVAGESYAFSVTGITLADPHLEIFDQNGVLEATDDDGAPGPGTDLLARFTAVTSGTYYISAEGFETSTGSYTVTAAHGPPQNPLDTIDLGFTFDTHDIAIYFATAGQHFAPSGAASRSWTASEKAQVMSALATISAVTDLHFTITNSSAAADFTFTLDALDANVLAQTFPGAAHAFLEFDPNKQGWNTAGLQPGGLGYSVIIHEVGHALGLDHPFEDGQDNQVMQGVTSEFDSYGTFLMNQQVFTIMSYNDGWPLGPSGVSPSNNFGYSQTMMGLDIAALQLRYGANLTANSGNNTYVLNGSSTVGGYIAIWDTGGSDSITYAGAGNATIDLRPATLHSEIGGGGFVSFVSGAFSGFTIASGVVIENATGGSGNDSLTGNDANNTLNGGAGNDSLFGGAGNDMLIAGGGADFIDGGDGNDTASFAGNVFVNANLQTGTAAGGIVLVNIENLIGSSDNDTLTGNTSANTLSGGDGNDTLIGAAGADGLDGGAGNDTLTGGAGADVLSGGAGVNTADYSASAAGVIVDLQNNVASGGDAQGDILLDIQNLLGSAFADTLIGNALANGLTGGAGADALTGGDGDDTLIGGAGADHLDGGAGVDTASYSSAAAGVVVNLSNIAGNSGDAAGDTYVSIQVVIGSGFADTLTGDSTANKLNGGAGADAMSGGAGNDTYVVDNVGDVVSEANNSGTELVQASITYRLGSFLENLTLTGTAAINGTGNTLANTLTGNSAANLLNGGVGDDTLNGGAGADTLIGGAGNDTYVVDNVGDVVTEANNGGTDLVQASITYQLNGFVENLTLTGAAAINATGNTLANTLTGNSAANVLNSGVGDDTLAGGAGHDILKGGTGADHFVFASLNAADSDTISDFSAVDDTIYLDNSVLTAVGANGALSNTAFWSSTTGLAHDADDRVIYNTNTGQLFYDADGNGAGAAILIATLTTHPALDSTNFFI